MQLQEVRSIIDHSIRIWRMALKYIFLVALVVVLGVLVSFQFDRQEGKALRAVQPEIREIKNTITLPGEVISRSESKIASPRSGRLNRVFVVEGQVVEQGQFLAQLDDRESLAWLNRSQAILRLRQNNIDHLARVVKRLRHMSEVGGESAQQLDSSIAEWESAKTLADIARKDVDLAKIVLSDSKIVAMHPGTIVQSLARPGEWVDPTKFLFRLADTKSVVIEAKIDGADIDSVNLGQSVVVTTEGVRKSSWKETVTWISPAAEREGIANTFRIQVSLGAKKPFLRIGQQVDLEIITGFRESASVLPIETIDYSRDGTPLVGVLKGDKVLWVPVDLGIESFTHVEVLGGIEKEDHVIFPSEVSAPAKQKVSIRSSAVR